MTIGPVLGNRRKEQLLCRNPLSFHGCDYVAHDNTEVGGGVPGQKGAWIQSRHPNMSPRQTEINNRRVEARTIRPMVVCKCSIHNQTLNYRRISRSGRQKTKLLQNQRRVWDHSRKRGSGKRGFRCGLLPQLPEFPHVPYMKISSPKAWWNECCWASPYPLYHLSVGW